MYLAGVPTQSILFSFYSPTCLTSSCKNASSSICSGRSISSPPKIFTVASGRRHIYHNAIDALIYRVPLRSLSLPFSLFHSLSLSLSFYLYPCLPISLSFYLSPFLYLFRATIGNDSRWCRSRKEDRKRDPFTNVSKSHRFLATLVRFSILLERYNLVLSRERKSSTMAFWFMNAARLARQLAADVTRYVSLIISCVYLTMLRIGIFNYFLNDVPAFVIGAWP